MPALTRWVRGKKDDEYLWNIHLCPCNSKGRHSWAQTCLRDFLFVLLWESFALFANFRFLSVNYGELTRAEWHIHSSSLTWFACPGHRLFEKLGCVIWIPEFELLLEYLSSTGPHSSRNIPGQLPSQDKNVLFLGVSWASPPGEFSDRCVLPCHPVIPGAGALMLWRRLWVLALGGLSLCHHLRGCRAANSCLGQWMLFHFVHPDSVGDHFVGAGPEYSAHGMVGTKFIACGHIRKSYTKQ